MEESLELENNRKILYMWESLMGFTMSKIEGHRKLIEKFEKMKKNEVDYNFAEIMIKGQMSFIEKEQKFLDDLRNRHHELFEKTYAFI